MNKNKSHNSWIKRLFAKQQPVNEEYPSFVLSENALLFIKKYAIPALNINTAITKELEYKIFDFATECELNMIDPLSKHGADRQYDYPEKERDCLGDKYVSEVSGRWANNFVVDLNDLNKRLGF